MDFTPEQLAQIRAIVFGQPPLVQGTNIPQPPPTETQSSNPPASSLPHSPQLTQAQQNNAGARHLPLAAPVNQPYTSARSSQANPAGFQPFLGAARLGGTLDTRHANQARVSSASRNLPRPVHLPSQNRRTPGQRGRGPSVHPPALNPPPSLQSSINSCQYVDVEGERNMVRITVKIYPVYENSGHTFILYRFIQQQVNDWLRARHLQIDLELNITTPVSQLMNTLVSRLERCPMQYQFPPSISRERVQLRLLSLVNRGQVTGVGYVRLKAHPADSSLTLADLLADKGNFVGASSVCIESQRLVIYIAANSLSYSANQQRYGHTRLAKAFAKAFPHDSPFSPLHISNETNSEDDSGDDTEVDEVAARIPPSIPRVGSVTISPYLPHEIWVERRIPDSAITRYSLQSMSGFAEQVRSAATAAGSTLEIQGGGIDDMVQVLDQHLDNAVALKDYSVLLSQQRRFERLGGQDRFVVSAGPGLEREVLFTAFQRYHAAGSLYFLPREDGFCALQVAYPLAAPDYIPQQRLQMLEKLGALCALLLISGQCPYPFDPLFFHYIVQNCKLESLSRSLLGEWHPGLRALISQWLEMGPAGDVAPFRSHFASLWDTDVSIYADRDEASHKQLASEMLYRAVLGPIPPSHQEIKSFARGFSLPCPNRNFTFIQVLKEVEGGSDVFLSLVWSTQVGPQRFIENADITFTHFFDVQLTECGVTDSPRDLVEKFISGRGIPDGTDLDGIIGNLSPLIDLDQSSSPTWRARMFTLAATGHPFLEEGNDQVNVQFVDDHHPLIIGTQRSSFQAGTITFRTCSRHAILPSSYILSMAQEHQNQTGGVSFQNLFDKWLLVQLLTAIGGHSIF